MPLSAPTIAQAGLFIVESPEPELWELTEYSRNLLTAAFQGHLWVDAWLLASFGKRKCCMRKSCPLTIPDNVRMFYICRNIEQLTLNDSARCLERYLTKTG